MIQPRGRPVPRGFTLIELMVVVAIVVMAMGIMVPTLLEFFRNQKLKKVQSHFTSAFNIGRLMAIQEGTSIRVVFFAEGARVYNTKTKAFRRDEEFIPESAPGSLEGISFRLVFANNRQNSSLKRYRDWEKEPEQEHLNELPGKDHPLAGQCDVKGLPGIEYLRDGTVLWMEGSDIPSSKLKANPPEADIIARQKGNPEALLVDIKATGPARTLYAILPEEEER